ncbi:vanin-like protein 1 [Phymastichus coffea]|uniref:vanin-like protein 1 n=1 Tax=Phymastichus coffea TaxID=108790 RepID=UPI00273C1890|nr:vanin-like protein 1 [Phymastichus coffea]XP_058806701.1 vanin-like protein 1 [Phymastichus coffea]
MQVTCSSLGALLLLLPMVSCASSPSSPSYIGAVVEYRPVTEGRDGLEVAAQNANHLRTIVKKASESSADIIVFPEVGLSSFPANLTGWSTARIREHYYHMASYLPDSRDQVVLCGSSGNYTQALKSVSCAARAFGIYVVVNHYEKVDCRAEQPNCAGDGFLIYNTNVVFDRQGRLIARYRKYNLFFEPGVNVTAAAEISIFDTDFGVRFGQIICNDILYGEPALELASKHGKDVVFSAEWFSELPFLTSVQAHSAWAYANDVNLLSSGFNEPAITNGGSGIYLGRAGISRATIPNVASNVLIVTEIPKVINGQRQPLSNLTRPKAYAFSQSEVPTVWDNVKDFMYKDDFRTYTTELVDPKQLLHERKLCNRGLCCDFKIDVSFNDNLAKQSGKDYYRYRIGVFNGTRLFAGLFTVGIQVCGLFFCRDDTLASCGDRFSPNSSVINPTVFHKIEIKQIVSDRSEYRKTFYLPMTLTANLMPVDYSKIKYQNYLSEIDGTARKLSLRESESQLMAFAIYGRNLANDGANLTKP